MYRVSQRKYSSLTDHDFLANEAVITQDCPLDRGKAIGYVTVAYCWGIRGDIDAQMRGCIFLDMSKISEIQHIRY